MARRRLLRIRHTDGTGRRFILEEVADRPHPQLRVWLPIQRRYARMTISLPLRDDAGRRSPPLIGEALQHCEGILATEPSFALEQCAAPATLRAALDYAVDQDTTKRRTEDSAQSAEWRRARSEVLSVLADDLPLGRLSAHHVYAVATSAMARVAYAFPIDAWRTLRSSAAAALGANLTHTPQSAQRVIALAITMIEEAKSNEQDAGDDDDAADPDVEFRDSTLAWARRTTELLRAMLRHAARRERERFGAVGSYELPDDVHAELLASAGEFRVQILGAHRPAYGIDDVRALMDHVRDPRYALLAALASALNGASALRVPRTRIRIDEDGSVFVGKNSGSEAEPRLSWTALEPSAAAVVVASLRGPFAALEQRFLAHGVDYCPIMDVRWKQCAFHSAPPTVLRPKHPRDVGRLDPRAWWLGVMAPEGRGGQVLRCWRSDLRVEQQSDQLLLAVKGSGTKRGPTWMLCEQQQVAMALAMEVGHLSELERLYQNGSVRDYPSAPAGRLCDGRIVGMGKIPLQPVDKRTMNDWVREIEAVLDIPHVVKRGWHGWRRACTRLFDLWHTNERVKDLITGHAELLPTTHGATRKEVYLDNRDIRVLMAAQSLCEHVRTEFTWTGAGPGATASAEAFERNE